MASKNSTKRRSLVKKCIGCSGKGFVFLPDGKKNCNKCYGRGMR